MTAKTIIIYAAASLAISIGGYIDYKTREIPNFVPISLIVLGLFLPGALWLKAVRMALIFALMLAAGKLTKQMAGMGDMKLYAALGFFCNIPELILTMALTVVLVFATSLVLHKKWDKKRKVPLCTYVAPAFILMWSGDWFILRQIQSLLIPA